ncbi:MAG TPA: asparagine synthase (glutamine-hydrolyzing) [Kofleriaceae bacterium]|jgi:asparagine synthase (glutamine-hydrolysing)
MCGLVGVFGFTDFPREELEKPVRRMTALMTRRGPDDEGFWTDGARCALAFRRLSILDLTAAGHQPMVSRDGRYVLVFNGEIYNYRELRAELETLGHQPRSSGDAEVLLLALVEWGSNALERLNGMFALALYDTKDKRLLLARDHAGIKPLHYAVTQQGVVFGSQYDQLLVHPWCADARVDRDVLGLYLRFGFVPAPYGLHRTTAQIEAGEFVEIGPTGALKRGRFFELPKVQKPTLRGTEAIETLDAALVASVKRQLQSDVPLGVLLSGGIDSPLVAAEAARQHNGSLHAFTIEVDDPRHDEGPDAKRYADEIGLDRITERVTAVNAVNLLDDVIAASTEPTADYSMFPTLMVSRLARRTVKVVLSGDGGDELFWGYPSRFAPTIDQARYFNYPLPLRYAAVAARRLFKFGTATRDVVNYDSVGRLYQRKHTLLNEGDLAAIFPSLPQLPTSFTSFVSRDTDPDAVAQWTRWNEFRIHLARVLDKVDRASMFNSLEVRVPLLDRDVIDVAWRTDWKSCLDLETRIGKRVLRSVLARRVRHQTTSKRGFTVPMAAWLKTTLRPLVEEHLLRRDEFLGLPVRRGEIARIYSELCAGNDSKAWGLWLLLSLVLWSRAHAGQAST